jgi:hypothetical protein
MKLRGDQLQEVADTLPYAGLSSTQSICISAGLALPVRFHCNGRNSRRGKVLVLGSLVWSQSLQQRDPLGSLRPRVRHGPSRVLDA